VDNSTGHVRVQWSEPALWQQNGAVTGYVVQYQRQTSKSEAVDCTVLQPLFISVDVNTTEFDGAALLAGSVYKLSVAGKTRAGTGVFSACTSIKVPSSASSSSSSTGTAIGAGAGVGGGLLIVCVLIIVLVRQARRRRVQHMLQFAASSDDNEELLVMRGLCAVYVWCGVVD
jgi:hypothetical protein